MDLSQVNPWVLVTIGATITALATGLGVLPFIFWRRPGKRLLSWGNAMASALMVAASLSLIFEGWHISPWRCLLGIGVGVVFITLGQRMIHRLDNLHVGALRGADAFKAVMIMAVMTIHSAAEGVGVGVAYGGEEGLGTFISAAIALHNIPEGLAIALILIPRGCGLWSAAGWAVVSSVPQPLLALPAYGFVVWFAPVLPIGLGMAAGAMLWMTTVELIPEAVEHGTRQEVVGIVTTTLLLTIVIQFVF